MGLLGTPEMKAIISFTQVAEPAAGTGSLRSN